MDDSEELDYTSSVDPFQAQEDKPSVDAPDERALVRVDEMLRNELERFSRITGLKRFDTVKFNADQREAMCGEYVMILKELHQLVNNAIAGIKEKQNGRKQ